MASRFYRTLADENVRSAERVVVEAAREWANNIDHSEHDLLIKLRRAVRNLEQSEHERALEEIT